MTNFSELKFDHRFGCPLIDNRALQLSRRFELFSPPVTAILAKPHDGVSLLTEISELKFDHRFRCAFAR